MAKTKALTAEDYAAADAAIAEEPGYVPGAWYMVLGPGGFTYVGRYVKPLGLGTHRFADVRHMRNAGQHELPEICRKGVGQATFTRASWPFWDVTPIGSGRYYGPIPADWQGGRA